MEQKQIFLVIQNFPFSMHYRLIKAFGNIENANKFATEQNTLLPESDKPVHDDDGLVEGVEFIVVPLDFE